MKMDYSSAVKFVEAREKFGVNLGLSRIRTLLYLLGDPQKKFKSVHIAGTNGKGSVAAMLSSILKAAGYKVGLYTSPHFISYTERIRINEKDISEKEFAAAVAKVKAVYEAHRRAIGEATVFEILTAAAFIAFASSKIDVAILEVGLGGRLDATNVVTPLVSVITNVELDHTEVLGNTITKIAKEKAGIIKSGVPVVTAAKGAALKVIRSICKRKGSPLFFARVTGKNVPPLFGPHQRTNLSVAISVIDILKKKGILINSRQIKTGLKRTRWRGRFEIVSKRPMIILDGAHNPAGALALKKAIEDYGLKKPITLILGSLKNKDIGRIARTLVPISRRTIITMSSHPNAAPLGMMEKIVSNITSHFYKARRVPEALRMGEGYGDDSAIIVTGSLFTVADAIKAIDYRR